LFGWPQKSTGSDERCCTRPDSIAGAIIYLDACLEIDEKQKIKESSRKNLVELHFGLGMQIRNEWGLWHDSPIVKQFRANGIFLADDMSALVIDIYWKHLNGLPLDFKESVALLRKEYDKLGAQLNREGVVAGDNAEVTPLPNPEQVKDRFIELE
jgi:hypothetical protein